MSSDGGRTRVAVAILAVLAALAVVGCQPPPIVIVPNLLPHRFLATSATQVFESTDGGDTWHVTAGQPHVYGVPPIAMLGVAMTAAADVAIGESAGKHVIWYSTDRGETWKVGKATTSALVDLSCRGSYCAAIATDGNGWVSTNGGTSWRSMTIVPLIDPLSPYTRATAVAVLPDGDLVAVGHDRQPGTISTSYSTAYRSSDVGVTWTSAPFPAPLGWGGAANAIIDLTAAGTSVVAVGNSTDFKPVSTSSDDGATWIFGGAPGPKLVQRVADDGADAIVVYAGPTVKRSADGGATWTPPTTQPPARSGVTVTYSIGQRGDDVVVVGQSVGGISVSVSHDRGLTWADAAGQPPGAPTLTSVSD